MIFHFGQHSECRPLGGRWKLGAEFLHVVLGFLVLTCLSDKGAQGAEVRSWTASVISGAAQATPTRPLSIGARGRFTSAAARSDQQGEEMYQEWKRKEIKGAEWDLSSLTQGMSGSAWVIFFLAILAILAIRLAAP